MDIYISCVTSEASIYTKQFSYFLLFVKVFEVKSEFLSKGKIHSYILYPFLFYILFCCG